MIRESGTGLWRSCAAAVAPLTVLCCLLWAGPAAAAPTTFSFTGAEQTYTVPAGITSIAVDAAGAAGELGGKGARVRADLAVSPGQTLYVEIGASGQCNGAGLAGSAASGDGLGGGGASDLRTVPVTDGGGSLCGAQSPASLASRLIVAGGGGGGSSYGINPGGDAGEAGAPAGAGGGAGTATAGGIAGPGGNDGGLGFGGHGTFCCPFYAGGGGGGGLYGGGSGGYSQDPNAAGGGGGGSSLVPAGGAFDLATGPSGVTITPQHSLALTVAGNGSGFVDSSPAGLDCGRNVAGHGGCDADFAAGATVTLTAHPSSGTDFAGFSGGACAGAGTTCTVPLDGDETVAAEFLDPAPAISGLRLSPDAFEPGSADTAVARRAGAEIRLSLSEDASVRFRIKRDPQRPANGSPPRNKRSFRRALGAGASSVPFSARFDGRALKPGRYRLLAVARDSAGQASATARARFTVEG